MRLDQQRAVDIAEVERDLGVGRRGRDLRRGVLERGGDERGVGRALPRYSTTRPAMSAATTRSAPP